MNLKKCLKLPPSYPFLRPSIVGYYLSRESRVAVEFTAAVAVKVVLFQKSPHLAVLRSLTMFRSKMKCVAYRCTAHMHASRCWGSIFEELLV